MQEPDGEARALTPEESWRDIHETMDRARSSMYVAGTATITFTLGRDSLAGSRLPVRHPDAGIRIRGAQPVDFRGAVGHPDGAGYGGKRVHRTAAPAGRSQPATPLAAPAIRVFPLLARGGCSDVPHSGGSGECGNSEDGDKIPSVAVGIVSLAYILFGIMHRPVFGGGGARGFAAAFYIPNYLVDGDEAMLVSAATDAGSGGPRCVVDTQERGPLTDEPIVLNETIHQPNRLRIMTLLVSLPETDRMAYGFIQQTLALTGGNLTTHLRKLEDADYLVTTKEFQDSKPRTWVQATPAGRRDFAEYLSNLQKVLNWQPRT